MILTKEVIEYLLRFLVGTDDDVLHSISYGKSINTESVIHIVQSDFFDENVYLTEESIPDYNMDRFDGVPFLFGKSMIGRKGKTTIIYMDWIASTYYLVSRYEELVQKERDKHGRMPSTTSILGKSGNLFYPLVEMWGLQLRYYLREAGIHVNEPQKTFNSICLSHDVDKPWHNYSLWNSLRKCASIIKHNKQVRIWPILSFLGKVERDSYFSFNRFFEDDKKVKAQYPAICKSVYFIVSGCHSEMESTFDYIRSKHFNTLIDKIENSGAEIGWHISYEAATDFALAEREKEQLDNRAFRTIMASRNHYLRSNNPDDFERLIALGITDDYSMGFADCSGFRLGTCRAVKWINPRTGQLTDLVLHPLMIMDVTLIGYMKLSQEEAEIICDLIIERTRQYHGDLTLLWHNETISYENKEYTRELYSRILKEI